MGKARTMADQFRKSFDEMSRQAELDELRKEINALREQRPLADIQSTMQQSILPPDLTSGPANEMSAPATGVPETAESDPAKPAS
jgi:sec-independent protein translocase protein TatB